MTSARPWQLILEKRNALAWLFLGCLLLGLTGFSLLWWDIPLTRWCCGFLTDAQYQLLLIITEAGNAGSWIVCSLAVSLLGAVGQRFSRPRSSLHALSYRLMLGGAFVMLSLLAGGLVANMLKIVVGRYRPYYYLTQDLYGVVGFTLKHGMHSFPSGHAQAVFSACTALSLLMPRLGAALIPLASWLAFTRVLTRYHFLSDVLIGSLIGMLAAYGVYLLFSRLGLWPFRQTEPTAIEAEAEAVLTISSKHGPEEAKRLSA